MKSNVLFAPRTSSSWISDHLQRRRISTGKKTKHWSQKLLCLLHRLHRYLDLSLNTATRSETDYIMCLGPGCGKLQIHEGGEANNIVTCSYCQFKMCFIHQRPMHHGLTCAQFDEVLAADEAQATLVKQNEDSVEMTKKKYQFCPGKGCGVPIELTVGCSHMTCKFSAP